MGAEDGFLVHLGDIQTQGRTASSSYCAAIAEVLRRADMPTFILPGDNEWNDQEDPERAWDFWSRSFMQFHLYWDRAQMETPRLSDVILSLPMLQIQELLDVTSR